MSKRRVSICKPTGGAVDLSLVVDMDAVRKRRRAEREARVNARIARKANVNAGVAGDPLHASADEKRERAELRAAWQFATPGPEKRAALAALRAYEKRHGMDAWQPSTRDRSEALAVSAERWDN